MKGCFLTLVPFFPQNQGMGLNQNFSISFFAARLNYYLYNWVNRFIINCDSLFVIFSEKIEKEKQFKGLIARIVKKLWKLFPNLFNKHLKC